MEKELWFEACSEIWKEFCPDLDEETISKEIENTWSLAYSIYMCDDFVIKYTDPVAYAKHCIKLRNGR